MDNVANDSLVAMTDGVYVFGCHPDSVDFPYVYMDSVASVLPQTDSVSMEEELHYIFPSSQVLHEYAIATPKKERELISMVPSRQGEPRKETLQQSVWFTPLLLFMAVVYTTILSRHSKTMAQEVKEFFYPKNRNDLFNSSVSEVSRLRLILGGMSILSTVLFCYFALSMYLNFVTRPPFLSLTGVLGLAVAYIFVKALSFKALDYVFFFGTTDGIVKRAYSTLTTWLGIALFVVVLLAAYSSYPVGRGALLFGFIVCGCAVLLYVYKILTIFFTGFSSLFYLILYLCTLEILPSLALVIGLINIV